MRIDPVVGGAAEPGLGVAGLGVVGAPGECDWVSTPGVPVLGFCDSEVVCAPAGEASITPKTARQSQEGSAHN